MDTDLIAIIIIDILGISVFIWFLSSRLSMKLKVIEERKSRRPSNGSNAPDGESARDGSEGD